MHQYLTEENLVETFKSSQQYTEGLTDNFPEYERIARNKPHASIAKELPKTTDGTTASIIRKTPHRVIQQLPTGVVRSTTEDWLSVVASFIYRKKIIPSANVDYALLQKCWLIVEKFLTYGFAPTYTPFLDHYGYFCPDLKLPYWGDIFLQPGKMSDEASNYIFMRSWWQTADIDALIKQQRKLKDTTWNLQALSNVKDWRETKDEKAKNQMEKDKQVDTKGGVQLVTGFQRGQGAKFFTFHVGSGELVRTKKNKDPRGEMPVSFAYGDLDGYNPFGRGIVDLVGPLQNLMDGEMQMYQFNRALMLAPPLLKKGNWDKNKAKLSPNAVIDLGTDTNSSLEVLNIDSSSLQNFAQNYGLMKSQLINLLASPDTSISAEVGNPGFSRTPAGIRAMQSNISVDDNYVRKQFETWFERWSETAINLFFAERTGIEELQLDRETVEELMELAQESKFDPAMLSPDGKIRINYDTATPALKFEVDASTSKLADDQKQLEGLDMLTQALAKNPVLAGTVPPQKVAALWNALVDVSGVENPEKVRLDAKDLQAKPNPENAVEQAKLQLENKKIDANTQLKGAELAQEDKRLGLEASIAAKDAELKEAELRQSAQSDIMKVMQENKKMVLAAQQNSEANKIKARQASKPNATRRPSGK